VPKTTWNVKKDLLVNETMIALFQVRNIVLDAENPLLIAMHQVPSPTCLTCVFLLTVMRNSLIILTERKT